MVSQDYKSTFMHRLLKNAADNMTPDLARLFLGMSFTEEDFARMDELADRNTEGELSPEEHDELHMYVVLNDLLAIMQLRAQAMLENHSPAA